MEQVGTEANVLPQACSGVLVLDEDGFGRQGIRVELFTYAVFTRTYMTRVELSRQTWVEYFSFTWHYIRASGVWSLGLPFYCSSLAPCEFTSCRAPRIAAKKAEFHIVIPPANIAKWSIWMDTRRVIKQTRRAQNVPMQLFVHHERLKLQRKIKEGRRNVTNDGELEERRGIRRQQNSSVN